MRRVARRKFRLFRHAHQLLRASLAPLPRLARPSGKPTPCPGIEPTASEENAVELLFLDGVYVEHRAGALHFRCVSAPTSAELTELAQRIAQRVGRYLERQGLLQRDAQHSYLAGERIDEARPPC